MHENGEQTCAGRFSGVIPVTEWNTSLSQYIINSVKELMIPVVRLDAAAPGHTVLQLLFVFVLIRHPDGDFKAFSFIQWNNSTSTGCIVKVNTVHDSQVTYYYDINDYFSLVPQLSYVYENYNNDWRVCRAITVGHPSTFHVVTYTPQILYKYLHVLYSTCVIIHIWSAVYRVWRCKGQ